MRHVWLGLIAWFSTGTLGCTDVVDLYAPCPNRNYDYADGNLDPCAAEDAMCPAGCIPFRPDQWWGPIALRMGVDADARDDCPWGEEAFRGYTWPDPSPTECAECRCERPTGTCELPAQFTANGATCTALQPSTPTDSFDAPASWNGACTAANPVSMGVQSLSIGPMKIEQTGCEPAMDPTPALVAQGTSPVTFGRACQGEEGAAGCGNTGDFCAVLRPRYGFRHCIYKDGKHACPLHQAYSERFIFYQTYEDKRDCSPCECGVPTGSMCTAQISLYSNSMCSGNPIEEWTHTSIADPTACKNFVPPTVTMLGSKEASAPIYTPGECTPFGGNPIGSIVGSGEIHTACCLPLP